jgi:hypothetical protein
MSEVQATFTVDGVSFTKKSQATTYAGFKESLEAAGHSESFVSEAMRAYRSGLIAAPKKTRAKKAE